MGVTSGVLSVLFYYAIIGIVSVGGFYVVPEHFSAKSDWKINKTPETAAAYLASKKRMRRAALWPIYAVFVTWDFLTHMSVDVPKYFAKRRAERELLHEMADKHR